MSGRNTASALRSSAQAGLASRYDPNGSDDSDLFVVSAMSAPAGGHVEGAGGIPRARVPATTLQSSRTSCRAVSCQSEWTTELSLAVDVGRWVSAALVPPGGSRDVPVSKEDP
jgi:hypothetical protein